MTSGRGRGRDFTLQRYAMPTVDNLLTMERCKSCDHELSSGWKFCIYCGRPMTPRSRHKAEEPPAAIRPKPKDPLEPTARKYDAPFWVGVAMGVLGLALIIYAAVQIYSSNV